MMDITPVASASAGSDGESIGGAAIDGERTRDAVALDELALLARGIPEGSGGDAVDVAHGAGRRLVQKGDGVGGKDLAVAAGAAEPQA